MAEIEFDHYDSRDERRREALLTLGNGVLSWRASAPEKAFLNADSEHYAGFYRAGWFDNAQRLVNGRMVRVDSLINLPDPFGLTFSGDGEHWFESAEGDYRQSLNLETSVLTRDLQLRLGHEHFALREQRFVSLADPTLAVLRWEIESHTTVNRLAVRALLAGDSYNHLIARDLAYQGKRYEVTELIHDEKGFAALIARLPTSGEQIAVAIQLVTHPATQWSAEEERDGLIQQACWPEERRHWVIEKRVRVLLNDEIPRPFNTIAQLLPHIAYAVLLDAHQQLWKSIWKETDVKLQNASLDTPLRFGMWHVLQSSPLVNNDSDQGFPPRGWQEGYFAQIFWDEMFAFPFLASRFSKVSERLLRYRSRRLEVARQNARHAGYDGAMFPWRSARDGTEQTPPYRLNPLSAHWMEDPTCLQRHVGSAIAYDVWQHFKMTGDIDWLVREGAELMIEVARFWASVVTEDATTGRYMIRGVIGPDEYHNGYPGRPHPGLDNNAYTNAMAAWVLFQTHAMFGHLSKGHRDSLMQRLHFDDSETSNWQRIAQRMYLPVLPNGVLNQFDGYEALIERPSNWSQGSEQRLDWLLDSRNDSSDRYQLTKQPDVLTLFYLFSPRELHTMFDAMGYRLDEAALRSTATFHLSRITHESSLSKVICAGALASLQPDTSWEFYRDCLCIDLNAAPGSGTVEGVHLAAMAGAVDVLQRHYLGIRPAPDALYLNPCLPMALDGVNIGFRYHGQKIRASVERRKLTLELASDARPVNVCCQGRGLTLLPGRALIIDC